MRWHPHSEHCECSDCVYTRSFEDPPQDQYGDRDFRRDAGYL